MPQKINVQYARDSAQLRKLHRALVGIVSVMNRPQNDGAMVKEAGVALDRALFPLLVLIEQLGPIGVVDLADRAGRDHTTVSRQVAKLESLKLVARQAGESDRRVREAVITPKGKAMTNAIDVARERRANAIFASWTAKDFDELVRLTCKFADDVQRATHPSTPAGR